MMRLRHVLGIIAILASLAATACKAEQSTTVALDVRVNVCTSSGVCHALRVPDAEVVLTTQDGRAVASAKSADDGTARLTLDKNVSGQHIVVAKSPLWKDKERSTPLLVIAGSHHQLTLTGNLGQTCCAP